MFVLRFDNGTVKRTSPSGERPRADKLVEMFQLFSHHLASAGLPPTSLVMEEDDRAQVLLGWDQWKRLFELARLGQCELDSWFWSSPYISNHHTHTHTHTLMNLILSKHSNQPKLNQSLSFDPPILSKNRSTNRL